MKSLLVTGIFLASVQVFAQDHPSAQITGKGIELFEKNHAFSGQILDTPVFGAFEHEPFGAKVQIRLGEKTVTLELSEVAGSYQGLIVDNTQATQTTVKFMSAKKTGDKEGAVLLSIDGVESLVKIESESFGNNHFQKPRYTVTLAGQPVSIQFTGEACFGYSANLTMMIFGVYSHLLK